jgi:hypothetical protein
MLYTKTVMRSEKANQLSGGALNADAGNQNSED